MNLEQSWTGRKLDWEKAGQGKSGTLQIKISDNSPK